MKVSIINQQKAMKVSQTTLRRLVEGFLLKAAKPSGIIWGAISVALVDDAGSQAVNAAHLGHDYPTDVISFTFEPVPGDAGSGLCGEIVVNAEQAARLGRRYGGARRELALYLAHGCDHLSGEDDATPAQRRRMRRRELRWVQEAGR